ncbi:hypothetical protein ACJJTC_003765 [Scirpophaga incertulas]
MDKNQEYHDPDYVSSSTQVQKEKTELSEEEKLKKIKTIIRREFSNELEVRENDIMLIEQRMVTSRRMLHNLRYALVSAYYKEQKLQLSNSAIQDEISAQSEPRAKAEFSALLYNGQRRIHPSVRKLLGKKTVDLDEILLSKSRRCKTRRDYSALFQKKNYTIRADASTKTLRPEPQTQQESEQEPAASGSRPKKMPRHMEPQVDKVLTLDDPIRNKMKHRYRLIVGNTSKYAPGASPADRSSHQWLLYVRGPRARPDPSPVLRAVVATLHASYAPHHTVTLRRAPFHVSRRGWGEFPARLQLHFPLPAVNRPACLHHTIKLDRHYTGLQTLGAETIVDVWLYSTPEMLDFEYVDPIPAVLSSSETVENNTDKPEDKLTSPEPSYGLMEFETSESNEHTDSWKDFFSKDSTELDIDEMIIKPVKKMATQENCNNDNYFTNTTNEVDNVIVKTERTESRSQDTILPEELNPAPDKLMNFTDTYNTANEVNSDLVKTERTESWSQDATLPDELNPAPDKRLMKYIDSTTGKIYYLELDRKLDLSKVQEIVINESETAKISPVKSNGLKSFRIKRNSAKSKHEDIKDFSKSQENVISCKEKCSEEEHLNIYNYAHIENDHCYTSFKFSMCRNNALEKDTAVLNRLHSVTARLPCVRMAVSYMLKELPIITQSARRTSYTRCFPFAVESEEKYWKLDFAKRRNIEWSRAKLINKILCKSFKDPDEIWRTKQILIFSRLHAYHPIRTESQVTESEEWTSWNDIEGRRKSESNIKEVYPEASDICSLSIFNSEEYLSPSKCKSEKPVDSDETVDVLCCDSPVRVKEELLDLSSDNLTVLPVQKEEDRLRFLYIERKCADIGVELRNEDVGNGYSYSAVHEVLLSAMKSFAEELIRCSFAEKQLEDHLESALPIWIGYDYFYNIFL